MRYNKNAKTVLTIKNKTKNTSMGVNNGGKKRVPYGTNNNILGK